MKSKLLTKQDKLLLKRILAYIKPYKLKYILLVIITLGGITVGLIQPLFTGKLAASLLYKDFNRLLNCVAIISILSIIQMALDFLKSYGFTFLNNNVMRDLNCEIYKKIINLSVKAFDEMRIGDFISRLNNDTSVITGTITNQLINSLIDVIRFIALGVLIFKLNITLALVTALSFPVSYMVIKISGKIMRRKNEEIRKINDNYFSNVQQSLAAIRDIKSLGIKENIISKISQLINLLRGKSIEISVAQTLSSIATRFTLFIISTLQICIGGYLVFKNQLSIEIFFAFTAYSSQFASSLQSLTNINANLQSFLVSLGRIYDLVDNVTYKNEKFGDKSIKLINGDIEFDNVYFGYKENNFVLKGVNFKIKHNKKIAIIGKSGVGKTTIFNLLLRFYDPDSGEIRIDTINIKDFDEESLRSSIAVVRQEPFIFNISIRDNLLLANRDATDEEILTACKSACIHDYIMSLPDQYNAIIGENGVNLSGGQKQRIAIARALLKDAKIILFDEATSALDNESQYLIKEAISYIARNRTIIIIAHRLSTIIDADEILVIDEGKVIGRGNHNNLINNNNVYRKLYETEMAISKEINNEVS